MRCSDWACFWCVWVGKQHLVSESWSLEWGVQIQDDPVTWHCFRKLKCDLAYIYTGWPSRTTLFREPEVWLCVRTHRVTQSHAWLGVLPARWPSHMTFFQEAEAWLGVHTHKMTQSHDIVSESWNVTWSTYTQDDPATCRYFRKLKHDLEYVHTRTSNHMTLFQEAERWLGVHTHKMTWSRYIVSKIWSLTWSDHTFKMNLSYDIVSGSWSMIWSTYIQDDSVTWHCFKNLKLDLECLHT